MSINNLKVNKLFPDPALPKINNTYLLFYSKNFFTLSNKSKLFSSVLRAFSLDFIFFNKSKQFQLLEVYYFFYYVN